MKKYDLKKKIGSATVGFYSNVLHFPSKKSKSFAAEKVRFKKENSPAGFNSNVLHFFESFAAEKRYDLKRKNIGNHPTIEI